MHHDFDAVPQLNHFINILEIHCPFIPEKSITQTFGPYPASGSATVLCVNVNKDKELRPTPKQINTCVLSVFGSPVLFVTRSRLIDILGTMTKTHPALNSRVVEQISVSIV